MKPLRDDPGSLDRGEQLLSSLFDAVPKLESDPFAKRRILAKVTRRNVARRRNLAAIVVVSTLGLATAAFAMALVAHLQAPKPTPRATSPALTPPELTKQATPKVLATPPSAEAPVDSPAPKETDTARAPQSRAAILPAGEDPTLVASAIAALRNEHNPARARQLLSRYLKANPRGALAEEALALSIEAAVAMQDKQASSLARSYLTSYPNGRHRALADRVIAQSTSK